MSIYDIYPVRIESLEAAETLFESLGVWPEGSEIMAPKSRHFALKVGPLKPQAAQIIKQEMLSKGGEAAISGEVLEGLSKSSHVILLGTLSIFQKLLPKLELQPFGLKTLGEELEDTLNNLMNTHPDITIKCRDKQLRLGGRTCVMGILNVTPDSFSDGGRYYDPETALERCLRMEEEGADIIDIGAESTRPGAEPVSAEEELSRLLPVLKLAAAELSVPISVDTYKSEVAGAALDAGAHIINDVSGLGSSEMSALAADYDVPIIIMHWLEENDHEIMEGVVRTLRRKVEDALEAGVSEDKIILDPGVGFAKDIRQNLEIIDTLDALQCLGYPILLGVSRKSFIGNILNLPVEDRLEGTSAAVTAGIMRGANIIRVHDVKEMVRVARVTDAILRTGTGEIHG